MTSLFLFFALVVHWDMGKEVNEEEKVMLLAIVMFCFCFHVNAKEVG